MWYKIILYIICLIIYCMPIGRNYKYNIKFLYIIPILN